MTPITENCYNCSRQKQIPIFIGFAGTLVSLTVMGLVYYRLAAFLSQKSPLFFLQPVMDGGLLFLVFGGLLLLGVAMGGLGSIFSIRRFLKV